LDSAFASDRGILDERLLDGSFVLFEYAALEWIEHVKACGSGGKYKTNKADRPTLDNLSSLLSRLLQIREGQIYGETDRDQSAQFRSLFRPFGRDAKLQKMLARTEYRLGVAKYGSPNGDGEFHDIIVSETQIWRLTVY
jgi:hypothetical protein